MFVFVEVRRNTPDDDSNNYVFTLLTRLMRMFVFVVVSRNIPDDDNEFPFQQ